MNRTTQALLRLLGNINGKITVNRTNIYINGMGIIRNITELKGQELIDKLKQIATNINWDEVETEYECMDCGAKITLTDILKDGLTGNYLLSRYLNTLAVSDGAACQECLDAGRVVTCRICEAWHTADDVSYLERYNANICSDCYDNCVDTCEECGEYIIQSLDDEYVETYRHLYCSVDCAREAGFVQCSDCGDWIYEDDSYFDDGDVHCEACHDRYVDRMEYEDDNGEYVKSYSWKPNPKFKRMTNDSTSGTYYGFELEVSGAQREAPAFLNFFGDDNETYNNVYLKSDCSILGGGFEIVTHPMTAEYIRKEFKPMLSAGLRHLRQSHFRGHNHGGMHIHVSRSTITPRMFSRMCDLLYDRRNIDQWLVLTQRKEDELSHWASLYVDKDEACDIFDNDETSSDRYVGMNITNRTVEFRIFNSNLRLERVLKNLELVEALVNFSKTKYKPTMRMFLGYIKAHKQRYTNAYDFITEKNWNSKKNEFVINIDDTVEV